ncbi:MAG: hypothetical protein ACR5KV_05065 [Wolbachia sp.]
MLNTNNIVNYEINIKQKEKIQPSYCAYLAVPKNDWTSTARELE